PAAGPARRADRRLRFVVVQLAAVQHRAVAAAEPRSPDARRMRSTRRRGAGAGYERMTVVTGVGNNGRPWRLTPGCWPFLPAHRTGVRSTTSATTTACTTHASIVATSYVRGYP